MTLLVGAFLFVSLQCRPQAPARTNTARTQAQQREELSRRYWEGEVGVTDPRQMDQIRRAEAAQNQVYAQIQARLGGLRSQLKLGLTGGTITARQSDSLLSEIGHLNMELERSGIRYWQQIDSILTPVQRENRLAPLKTSSKRLMGRVNVPSGTPESDTAQ
jgi:hypothetical protein